jgi:hypothetical protein
MGFDLSVCVQQVILAQHEIRQGLSDEAIRESRVVHVIGEILDRFRQHGLEVHESAAEITGHPPRDIIKRLHPALHGRDAGHPVPVSRVSLGNADPPEFGLSEVFLIERGLCRKDDVRALEPVGLDDAAKVPLKGPQAPELVDLAFNERRSFEILQK